MTLSVVVPLYKGTKYIERIIGMLNRNKMLMDTYYNDEISIDLIFINDYPTERIEVTEAFKYKYRVYNHERNKGIHQSRVDGLRVSEGDYILFLDQDDEISDDYLFTQLVALERENADWVICNGLFRTKRVIYSCQQSIMNVLDEKHYFSDLTEIISPGQVLMKKSIIPGIWQDNILKNNYCDDAFLWLLIKNNGNKLAYNDSIGYFHNENGNNTSFSWEKNMEALEELKNLIMSTNCLGFENAKLFYKAVDKEICKQEAFANLEEIYESLDNKDINYDIKCIINECSIVIYGYGIWGRKLHALLLNNGIQVKAVIDQNIKGNVNGVMVYTPEEFIYHVTNINKCMLVITPFLNDNSLIDIIRLCGVSNYLTITKLFNRLNKEVNFCDENSLQ